MVSLADEEAVRKSRLLKCRKASHSVAFTNFLRDNRIASFDRIIAHQARFHAC